MRSRLPIAGVLLAASFAAVPSFGEPELVDRIVAIIDRDVVTLSEVDQAEAIVRLREQATPSAVQLVERLIEARLVEREVARFNDDPVSESEVARQIELLRQSFDSPEAFDAALAKSGVSLVELRAALARQLAVSRYLERRFRALTYVSEDEVAAYFREEIAPSLPTERAPSLDEVEQIRRLLEEEKFTERVDNWIEGLKERASIRRYVW